MKFVAPITFLTAMQTVTNVGTTGDPAAYNGATNYGTSTQVQYNNEIYQSKVAGNLGNQPDISPDKWADIGPINVHAMYDQRISSITKNMATISNTLVIGSIITDMSFLGVSGNTITITQTDPVDGVVYTEVQQLTFGVSDYDEYCFDPIRSNTVALFSGFQAYASAPIAVVIDNGTDEADCGACIFGYAFNLPDSVEYGLTDGIEDYSDVQTNEFGVRDIVLRDYSDDADFTVRCSWDDSPEFVRLLKQRHAQPTLIIPTDDRPDLQYWGLVTYRRTVPFFDEDNYAVSVKGFT